MTPTAPQQALWYRQTGDHNPLHTDPGFAAQAGYPRPILHGLCTYAMVAKAVIDAEFAGEVERVASYAARFSGVVFPGETLQTSLWREPSRIVLQTGVTQRAGALVLTGAELRTTG